MPQGVGVRLLEDIDSNIYDTFMIPIIAKHIRGTRIAGTQGRGPFECLKNHLQRARVDARLGRVSNLQQIHGEFRHINLVSKQSSPSWRPLPTRLAPFARTKLSPQEESLMSAEFDLEFIPTSRTDRRGTRSPDLVIILQH